MRAADDPVLVQHNVLRQHAVRRRTECICRREIRQTVDPALEEIADDAVACGEAGHAGTDGGDLARPVRQRHRVPLQHAAEVVAGDDGMVAIVQRRGMHADEQLAGPGRRHVALDQFEARHVPAALSEDVLAHAGNLPNRRVVLHAAGAIIRSRVIDASL